MLDVQLFDLHTFLPKPYEGALLPRLKKAHEKLQTGTGLGGEFTGWVHLPQDMTGKNLPESRLPPRRSKAILRHWWSSASAAAIWEPAA